MSFYIFIAFVIVLCIQVGYYIFVFGKFYFQKTKNIGSGFSNPVSVIVCAKNEAENLELNLPSILAQKYPLFEVVLINDCSTDNTLEVMENFRDQSSVPIKIVDIIPNEQFWGSKKYALTLGIKAATYEHLLFTDADCKPVSENWINEMVQSFSGNFELILGYSGYEKIKKSFLNKLIRFETLLTALTYFSFLKIGKPYMGVGRNIAYTKSLFFNARGFVNHMKILSGDDDLFVNQIATRINTSYSDSEDSFTISTPKKSFKDWILQKRRHISTAKHYKLNHKLLLGLFYVSQISFWVLSITLFSLLFNWQIVLGLFFMRQIIFYIAIYSVAKKLNEKDLVVFSFFYELFLICIQLFIFTKNIVSKPSHW